MLDEGGKGKRHKDEEGAMGKEESKKTNNKYAIVGPADNEDPHMAREAAKMNAAVMPENAAGTTTFNAVCMRVAPSA